MKDLENARNTEFLHRATYEIYQRIVEEAAGWRVTAKLHKLEPPA